MSKEALKEWSVNLNDALDAVNDALVDLKQSQASLHEAENAVREARADVLDSQTKLDDARKQVYTLAPEMLQGFEEDLVEVVMSARVHRSEGGPNQ